MGIVIAALVVGVTGLILGLALVAAGQKFHVETDPREAAVRERLPGNNCGACGYAGCDAVAAAIAKGEAPANACPVCSAEAAAGIAAVMGVEAGAANRRTAFVRCGGDCGKTAPAGHYIGVNDCRSAALSGVPVWACSYGCLGYGSCVSACDHDAIHVADGVAVVDKEKCVGCGLCVSACPKGLIELVPQGKRAAVRCSSSEKGAAIRKLCSAGCIGCGICAKQCPEGAVTVEGNLARVDYGKCTGCGSCVEKCPVKVISIRQ